MRCLAYPLSVRPWRCLCVVSVFKRFLSSSDKPALQLPIACSDQLQMPMDCRRCEQTPAAHTCSQVLQGLSKHRHTLALCALQVACHVCRLHFHCTLCSQSCQQMATSRSAGCGALCGRSGFKVQGLTNLQTLLPCMVCVRCCQQPCVCLWHYLLATPSIVLGCLLALCVCLVEGVFRACVLCFAVPHFFSSRPLDFSSIISATFLVVMASHLTCQSSNGCQVSAPQSVRYRL